MENRVPINVRVSPELSMAVDMVCDRLKLDRSEIVRRCIVEGLKLFQSIELPGSDKGLQEVPWKNNRK